MNRPASGRMLRSVGLAVVVGILFAGFVGGVASAEQYKVNMGTQPFISYAPIFIALEKGMFGEQQLEVKVESFVSAQKMMAPVAAGQLDVVGGALSAGFYNSVAKGLKMKIVADKGRWSEGHGITQIMVRKDLYDSGEITKIADLKGRKLINTAPLNGAGYLLVLALEHAGIPYDHSKVAYLGMPQIFQGMQTKAVEAGICVEPWCSRAVRENVAKVLVRGDELPKGRDFQIAYIIYTDKFISENREAAQRFMNAYMKAVRFYHSTGEQSDTVAAIISKHTKVPAELVKAAAPTGIASDGKPNMKSVAQFQDWLYENGFVKQKLNIDDLWDGSFVAKAVK